jgi:uncharacterized protein (TIGR03435 family)
MRRALLGATVAVFTSVTMYAQPAEAPAFEVASVKPAPPQPAGRVSTRISIDEARVILANVTLNEVIGEAYKVQQSQIVGPASLGSWRFDIAAKIPDGVPEHQVPQMLQTLLADRFKLALHRESRVLPVYALTVGKNGSKLKATESATGISSDTNRGGIQVNARVSIPSFAEFLSIQLGRPVIDRTGLTGTFDIRVNWAPDPVAQPATPGKEAAPDSAADPSVFSALQDQLGLKLEATRGPVEILVIDHVEEPTDN